MMSGFTGGELGSATGRRYLFVPTLYPRWCELRDVLGNHNIHVLITPPQEADSVYPRLLRKTMEKILLHL